MNYRDEINAPQTDPEPRLCYVPDIKSPRPVTILTRRITYPMRMPYGKRGSYHTNNIANLFIMGSTDTEQ